MSLVVVRHRRLGAGCLCARALELSRRVGRVLAVGRDEALVRCFALLCARRDVLSRPLSEAAGAVADKSLVHFHLGRSERLEDCCWRRDAFCRVVR